MKKFLNVISLAIFIICALVLGVDITTYAKEDKQIVSILGDSVSTWGMDEEFWSPYPYFYNMKEDETYWRRYIDINSNLVGKNDSISGSCIKNQNNSIINFGEQSRIDSLGENGNPNEIIVFGGINDSAYGVSCADFYTAYKQLLDKVTSKYINSKIVLLIPYFQRLDQLNLVNEYADVINRLVLEYTSSACEVESVDLRSVIDCKNDEVLFDGTHPTKLGHIIIFNKLMEKRFADLKVKDSSIVPTEDYTGFYENDYGVWYYKNGQIDCSYNGVYCDGTVVVGGYVDSNYCGVLYYNGEYYNVNDGKIESKVETDYTGMACIDGIWRYIDEGRIDWDYTGMACNECGWWYYRDGILDWNYTGEASNSIGTWFYQNGRINFDAWGMQYTGNEWRMLWGGLVLDTYTGMAGLPWGWYYFENGHLINYTGMACNECGWWYYRDGILDWNYTGEASNSIGTWFYQNGRINFDAWGMQYTGNEWRMLWGGLILDTYTGMAGLPWGWYYFENGHLTNYTGMACNECGWWYYKDGILDWGYTGFGENIFGKWLYCFGNIAFWYTGLFEYGGQVYYINNGHVE